MNRFRWWQSPSHGVVSGDLGQTKHEHQESTSMDGPHHDQHRVSLWLGLMGTLVSHQPRDRGIDKMDGPDQTFYNDSGCNFYGNFYILDFPKFVIAGYFHVGSTQLMKCDQEHICQVIQIIVGPTQW